MQPAPNDKYGLLTGDEVIAKIESFPNLNPEIGKVVIAEYRKSGVFVHAVLTSLNLEPVTMWRTKTSEKKSLFVTSPGGLRRIDQD